MAHDPQIVIGPDGTVLAATGELPQGLVDSALEDREDLSREVRDAGKALLRRLRDSGTRVLTEVVALDGGGRRVQLIAIEALAIRREPTDVRTLLTSKLDVLASQAAAADVTLSVVVADDVPAVVHLDAEKVAWAVTTLVGNALRYVRPGSRMMPGGTIAVRAAFDPAGPRVTIEVRDDGPGIPADTVARLFKRDGLNVRGAGLALVLMSDICVAHGGTIDVRSSIDRSGHGTLVRLAFPREPHAMTLAEILLLIAGGTGIYVLLSPLRRWLERYLARTLFTRGPRVGRPTIDVTDFTSHDLRRKVEDETDEHGA